MTDIEKYLADVKSRCDAATEGPWEENNSTSGSLECEDCGSNEVGGLGYTLVSTDEHTAMMATFYGLYSVNKPNMNFIAHARTDVPKLLAMLEKATTTLSYITDEANGKTECHNMANVCLSDIEKIARGDDE